MFEESNEIETNRKFATQGLQKGLESLEGGPWGQGAQE